MPGRRHIDGNVNNRVKASLRLCFVKLPGTQDHRIFRDVMTLEEPEDKGYQDLSDLVEKKLSFMEIPPADFTVFYTEASTTGDRVVVDDAYFGELVAGWFKRRDSQRKKARRDDHQPISHYKQTTAVNTRSFSQEAQDPLVLGTNPDAGNPLGAATASRGDSHSSSSGGSSSEDEGEDQNYSAGPFDVAVTFEVEVNRLRNRSNGADLATGNGSLIEQRTQSGGLSRTASGNEIKQDGLVLSDNCAPLSLLKNSPSPAEQKGCVSAAHPSPFTIDGCVRPASHGEQGPSCVPLTAQNLSNFVRQSVLSPTTPPPPAPPQQQQPTDPLLVHVAELVCPPQPPHFYLRCVVVDIRFKMPKPGLSIGEIDLCDAADPQQVITGVTFDASVQREMKECLRCDGRQVLELRRVYVRRKTEVDARYATNAHPLLLRIDRSSKIEVVQVLTVPVFSRAPVVSTSTSTGFPNGAGGSRPHQLVDPVFSARETANMRSGGGVVELSDLTRHRSGGASELAFGAGGGMGMSSASSSSTGPRRTTFTIGSGNNSVGGSGSGALVSGVVPSARGSQLKAQQQLLLARTAQLQLRQQQLSALPYEPGVIPVTLRDVRAREAVVEQEAAKEAMRKERIRRKMEVSQACILCGLDLSDGSEGNCLEMAHRLLKASSRNKGAVLPTIEELRDALGDRRPLLRQRQMSRSTGGSGGGGAKGNAQPTGASKARPRRLTCQHTFVNLQTRANHVVHCRCAHLCTAYQNGGSLEDIAWCDLPMQMCSLCGLPGAFVACYHPDCTEMYHPLCAIFSGGYVNFGKKDPFLPCPACPRHTQVILTYGKAKPMDTGSVLHVDESCWADDDIAFDSRVVAAEDLRDPDENDGE